MKKLLLILVLAVFSNSSIAAETANCSIKIKDYNSPDFATYTINKKFRFEKKPDRIDVQRMDFGLPGTSDYMCTLAFVRLGNGTSLQCRYLGDGGNTFFDSDRTNVQDKDSINNLLFRHKTANFSIKTKCK